MVIIFYDNFTSFKKSKLTYKLILSKQKQDSDWILFLLSSSSQKRKTSHCEVLLPKPYAHRFYDACVGLVQWSISNREDSHSVVVELAIAEMASVSSNVRRTFHVPAGVRVQRSISERDCSHPVFNAQAFPELFPILSCLMGSRLASCPFLRIVFLGFHCP